MKDYVGRRKTRGILIVDDHSYNINPEFTQRNIIVNLTEVAKINMVLSG